MVASINNQISMPYPSGQSLLCYFSFDGSSYLDLVLLSMHLSIVTGAITISYSIYYIDGMFSTLIMINIKLAHMLTEWGHLLWSAAPLTVIVTSYIILSESH